MSTSETSARTNLLKVISELNDRRRSEKSIFVYNKLTMLERVDITLYQQ